MRLVRGWNYTYTSSRKPCVYSAFSYALSFLTFMLEFAYAFEGGDTELSLGSLPVSNITIRSWSEVTLNPLVWNKGGKCFLINPVETVHVCRVKTAQSSRKQQLLSVPFSLEQTGIVFPGLFVLERLPPTVRTHDPDPWEDPPAPILSDPGPGAADPTPVGGTHSFLLSCYGLCPGTRTGPFSA